MTAASDLVIDRIRDEDFAEILRDFPRFWGERDSLRHLHHPMFVLEFGDTAFVARRRDAQGAGQSGRDGIVGYLLGFVAPTGDGYIHFVAVRDDARGCGVGRQLHAAFERAAVARGAVALKALTSPENEGSMAFHRRIGFTDITRVEDYGGWGRPRIVMRKRLR
jgi:ribosomal protein S18 acetylase RimI-like enzyme